MTCELSNDYLRLTLGAVTHGSTREYFLKTIELKAGGAFRPVAQGVAGAEFATSVACTNATTCTLADNELRLAAVTEWWEATAVITLDPHQPILRRRQTYRFRKTCHAAIHPGWRIPATPHLRYTYPLRAWEQPLGGLPPCRVAVDWALPFPFHVWHDDEFVAMYGLDKNSSPGTLDFIPLQPDGFATLRVYYPDTGQSHPTPRSVPIAPTLTTFPAGTEVTLVEILAVKSLAVGEEPLLAAERLATGILLRTPPRPVDWEAVANRLAGFYHHCELWEPDALGTGRGWFSNMWVRTHTGPAKKRGEMSGYFDFGWGEGVAVEMMLGAVRHWQRTGDTSLLPYVDEMSCNMDFFKRAPGDDQPYFDRTDGQRYGDFLMDHVPGRRIWTHSLGHTGSQLLQLYQAAPDYPQAETQAAWLSAAQSMAGFFARQQRADGDLNDIFDDHDREANTKPHRITARAVVCGLWVRLAQITGEVAWTQRARRLAQAVAPSISRYEYYNQMLDGIISPTVEYADGEAAYYVLEGLVPLYAETRDPAVLRLCHQAVAYGIAWTYFYDLPKAHNGIARGGQCCRTNDLPLLYPIGPAKAMTPLLDLHALTGDAWFKEMAQEAATFIGHWQMRDPGQPWDGGMIHALGQYCGAHWGPDLAGQIDSGMATGNSLAALENWLAHNSVRTRNVSLAHAK